MSFSQEPPEKKPEEAKKPANPAWNVRFKQASAAKRREKEATTEVRGATVDPATIDKARMTDPTDYLASRGYSVERQGRHLSVRQGKEEVYRITQKPDGHYVACTKEGEAVGDNIALVRREESDKSFPAAVESLTGVIAAPKIETVKSTIPERVPPVLPPCSEVDRAAGRDYLEGRGISKTVLDRAEKSGFVRYSQDAVLFCGHDISGRPQNVTRRDIRPDVEVSKRDLKGSLKEYAPILPGDQKVAWVVEGGTDALALQTMKERAGEPVPAVIVSGGARNRGFIDNSQVQKVLKEADKVVVANENEKRPDIQSQTDEDHKIQALKIKEITGKQVFSWRPTTGAKDIAEENQLRLLRRPENEQTNL
ncbi:MAG: hypothetical protein ACYDBP_07205 [Leptospirales bacterium]